MIFMHYFSYVLTSFPGYVCQIPRRSPSWMTSLSLYVAPGDAFAAAFLRLRFARVSTVNCHVDSGKVNPNIEYPWVLNVNNNVHSSASVFVGNTTIQLGTRDGIGIQIAMQPIRHTLHVLATVNKGRTTD